MSPLTHRITQTPPIAIGANSNYLDRAQPLDRKAEGKLDQAKGHRLPVSCRFTIKNANSYDSYRGKLKLPTVYPVNQLAYSLSDKCVFCLNR